MSRPSAAARAVRRAARSRLAWREAGALARARLATAGLLGAAIGSGAVLGCEPALPAPAPRVLSVMPEGTGVVPDAVTVVVTFSEPVEAGGIVDGRFLALVRGDDAKAAVREAGGATGIGPGIPVVAARRELADGGRRAELTPEAPLAAETDHAVVVGTGLRSASGRAVLDPTGRKRALAVAFRTGPMPDRIGPSARWAAPPHGPVPPNLREIRVAFSEPVTGTLALSGLPGVPTASGTAGAAGSGAAAGGPGAGSLELALRLLGPLPAGGAVALALDGVRDASGNHPSPLGPLAVSRCRDDAPPALDAASARILPADTSIAAAADAGEMARLGLEIAAGAGEEPCGDLPAPPATRLAWGDFAPCPGSDPCGGAARCGLAALADGLCPSRRHRVRLRVEDLAGNEGPPGPWTEVATAPARPRPVITEVLADAASPEAGGEYVEVANLGSGEADLAGFRLAKRGSSGAVSRCDVEPLDGPIPPGGHGLLVGGAWDGRHLLPAGVRLLRCGAGALAGGLASDRAPELALESPDGAVASGLGWAAPSIRCVERSVERVHPAGPDEPSNLACARAPPGTPGACNGATPAGECPRRPW